MGNSVMKINSSTSTWESDCLNASDIYAYRDIETVAVEIEFNKYFVDVYFKEVK